MNSMSSETRKYTLRARADHQAETRLRIVEATAALHDEVGPARTTVAEIARRAGVQRLTVYNNFPTDGDLFDACGQHWLSLNPPPDPTAAFKLDDPGARLRAVLIPFYRWYREHARGIENLQRDRLVLPALDTVMRARMDSQFSALADALAAGFSAPPAGALRVRGAIALALDFWTWRRLAQETLSDDAAAGLMVASVGAARQQ
jgi:AcrR family transcriptional regulator